MNQLLEFNGHEFVMVSVNGRRGFTTETVGRALGYSSPRRSINKLHDQYEDELREGIH